MTKGLQVKGRSSYSGTFQIIDSKLPSSVTVTISEYRPATVIIPGQNSESLGTPIGCIVASVLTYKQFCEINGQTDVIKYDDPRCKWVPADGRLVIGSKYGNIANKVPDLRGVFLRGLNDFGVVSSDVQMIDPQRADLDENGGTSNRSANSFEGDKVGNHGHKTPLPGGGGLNPAGGWALENVGRLNSIETSTAPSNLGNETQPRNVAVYHYIKIN